MMSKLPYKVNCLHAHLLFPEEIDRPFELRRQQKRLEEGERWEALPFVRALPKFFLQICDALLKPICKPPGSGAKQYIGRRC